MNHESTIRFGLPFEPALLATPPSKKKNKFRYGPRDSLRSRYKIGKPGSRRYRQWENEFFLFKNLSDTELESEDWDESLAPSYVPFAAVFEDENKDIWDPFIDTTEEHEKLMLQFYDEDDDEDDENDSSSDSLSTSDLFSLLRKRSQRTLLRHKDSNLLLLLDAKVFSYVNGNFPSTDLDDFEFLRSGENESLVFVFNDTFRRHLLHSLCEFYGLVSYSMDMSEERITVVYKRERCSGASVSLVDFLNSLDVQSR